MGPERCPFCGQEISTEATKCFFCDAALDKESIEHRLEQLHGEEERKSRKIRRPFILKALVVLVLICGALFFVSLRRTSDSSVTNTFDDSSIRLNAKVIYTGAQFMISNNDSYDWSNIELQISPETPGKDFSLRIPKISAGQSYQARAAEFATQDGICFDPYKMKPKRFRILCESPNGEKCRYFAGWK